jgi:hypothetical protein
VLVQDLHISIIEDLDGSLNETATHKIRQYHGDYNNRPSNVVPLYLLFLVRLGVYIVNLCTFYSYRFIGKLTVFFLHLQEFSM